jgi:hypothetical protein
MKINIKKILFIVFLVIAIFTVADFTLAASLDVGMNYAAGIGLGNSDPRIIIANIIRIVLGFLGIIALVLIIYAGWLWMTAGGESDKIDKAKKILIGAVIGMIISLSAFAIASFILSRLMEATGANGDGTTCDPPCTSGQYCCSSVCSNSPCGGSINPPGYSFRITSTRPRDQDSDVIRNVVIKAFFNDKIATSVNQSVLDSNFIIEKIATIDPATRVETQLATPQIITGISTMTGNRLEINFRDDDNCNDERNTLNCLPEWSKFRVTINGFSGIVSINNLSLTCAGSSNCVFEFLSSDLLDTNPPQAGIAPSQICKDDGSLKADANTVAGWGRDDVGISALEFYQKKDGASTDTLDGNIVQGSGKIFQVTHKYDTSAMTIGDSYSFSVNVRDVADHPATSSFSTTIKPGHCCNGTKDADETDVDCGGNDCLACFGGQCNKSQPNVCGTNNSNCSNNLCSSWFCQCQTADGCRCGVKPMILSVSPLGGFCSDDKNKFCQTDTDCGSAASCDIDTPNGAPGNFVTISGKYFGSTAGKVYFENNKEAAFPSSVNPECTSYWRDDQIIVLVPAGAVDGPIKVVDANNNSDTSNDDRGPYIKDFLINNLNRPGLCLVNPNEGFFNDSFNLQGNAFNGASQAVFFGDATASVAANNINGWSNTSVNASVPNLRAGNASIFVKVNNVGSNNLIFKIKDDTARNPIIDYIEPEQGPSGQYITIYGQNFKTYNAQTSSVKFYLPADPTTKINADIDFPAACRNNWWHNTYIIVKVPKVNSLGGYKVEITNNENRTSPPADFTIISGTPSPGLCLLDPNNGPVGTSVSAYGEKFGSSQGTGRTQYFNNKDGAVSSWAEQKVISSVPNGAASGPVRIINDQAAISNPLPFKVGKCSSNAECESGEECCGGGTYWSNICRAAGSCNQGSAIGCGFGWTFKTSKKQIGDPCYDGIKNDFCDISKSQCGNGLVCDTTSCVCKQPCNLNTGGSTCQPDNSKCAYTTTPVCNDTTCLCECTKVTDCKLGEMCDQVTNTCVPAIESCSGFSNTAKSCASQMCPNSPGQCSAYTGANTSGNCSDSDCNSANTSCNGNCTYDSGLNKCILNGVSCLDPQSPSILTKFDAEGSNPQADFNTAVELEGSNHVYKVVGPVNIFSSDFIPIDINKKYYIFGRFKSTGTGKVCIKNGQPILITPGNYKTCTSNASNCDAAAGETCAPFNSRLYFGLDLYNKDKKQITSWDVLRAGNDATVNSISNTQINVSQTLSGWYDQTHIAGERSLGFYYNGDTATKVPDYVYYWFGDTPCGAPSGYSCYSSPWPDRGAYNGTGINGSKVINLNRPLPADLLANIVPGTTVVKNHYAGGTYLYSAAANTPVPWDWENLAFNRGGISGEGFGYNMTQFRQGTKYAKVIFLFNYWQTNDEVIKFDDITFAEQQCKSVSGKDVLQINPGGISCPGGTYLDSNGWCTIIREGGVVGQPALCNLSVCPSGFSCQAGKCLIDKPVCPSGYSCQAGRCEGASTSSCECCCRIGYDAQDCCYPLKCQGQCGSDVGTTTTATFGHCSGCANAGTTQTEHNAACNCTGSSGKFCLINSANPGGICQDCSAIESASVCNTEGAGTCCVDAKYNVCRSGTDYSVGAQGSPVYNYCAYYECNTGSCSNTPVATSSLPTYGSLDECSNKCTVPAQFGNTCYGTATTSLSCDINKCSGFSCINEDGSGPSAPNCGTCCCDPSANPDSCKNLNPSLSCKPNQAPCTSATNKRGLCCGCARDSDCGLTDSVGCGTNTCCQARPNIIPVLPENGDINICRNTLIQAVANQPMQLTSFNNNIIVAGEYGDKPCPAETKYLTAAYKPSILARIKHWLADLPIINKLFTAGAEAFNGNFCTVAGSSSGYVTADNRTVIEYKLRNVLEANRKYYVIIKGDTDITDAIASGVISQAGIGFNPVEQNTFNGVSFKGRIWSFTTKNSTPADSGICQVDSVMINPASYLFTTSINDPSDDVIGSIAYDSTRDSDKVFHAVALDKKKQPVVPIENLYNWKWDWWIDNKAVVKFNGTGNPLLDNPAQTLIAQNVKDDNTLLHAQATITEDNVNNVMTVGLATENSAEVYVFLCANPWPNYKADGSWSPWIDPSNYNFQIYYCRDAGQPGTADDLPAILNSAVVGSPTAGVLKEYYFFREGVPDVSGINLVVQTNDTIKQGGKAGLSWSAPPGSPVQKYQVYYGTRSKTYLQSVTATTPGTAANPFVISNLINGVKYYFTVTAVYGTGGESIYSSEVSYTPADTWPPAIPAGLTVTSTASSTAVLSWTPNQDEAVAYKVSYGATSGSLGASIDLNKSKCSATACTLTVDDLNSGTLYYFAVSALDAKANESLKSSEINLIIL